MEKATQPNFINKLRQNTLYWFLAQAIVMYVAYQAFDKFYLEKNRSLNQSLTQNIAEVSAWGLRGLGYDSYAAQKQYDTEVHDIIYINARQTVYIEDGCNGLILMAFFVIFIIAYPGPILKKLWYIPAGMFVIYTINVVRCMVLAINILYNPASFDFNHKYLYSTLIYIAIFGLWMLWANKLSGNSFNQLGTQNTPESDA
ncbi:MAG: exosortase X [Flexibacteraceae bacterium]